MLQDLKLYFLEQTDQNGKENTSEKFHGQSMRMIVVKGSRVLQRLHVTKIHRTLVLE